MSLLLEHRWEHALVAAVIEAAKEACPTCYLGRTAIQKLLYFLDVLGVPMRFRFRIHHYGPYSDELTAALDWMLADDVVVDAATDPRYSNYSPGANWPDLKSDYQAQLEVHRQTITSVARVFGPMEPRMLELIATLDFSYRWVRARGGGGPWKPQAMLKLKEIKGNKFDDTEISDWYDRLQSASLIEA